MVTNGYKASHNVTQQRQIELFEIELGYKPLQCEVYQPAPTYQPGDYRTDSVTDGYKASHNVTLEAWEAMA